jgi:glycosyltransferase involved in cell wall biosynthesis
MTPLRIALLTSVPLPPREGIGFHVVNLAAELRRRGHSPTIITRGSPRASVRAAIDGVPTVGLPFVPLYPIHVQLHGIAVNRYLDAHRAEFDLIHAHTPLVPVPAAGLPVVTTVHTPMRADTAAIPLASLRGALIRSQGIVSARLETGLFARSGAIVAVAASVAQELAAYGIDPTTVPVLGNAVDPGAFTPGREAPDGESILYVGRLSDRKGLGDLVRAVAVLAPLRPNLRLTLVGDGPMEPELRRLAANLGIADHVIFAGHVGADERDRLVRAYRQTSVYVQPSHYEGLPTALLEAMACARPAIATAISGHLDAIADGSNGLLVPPRDHDALAAAIERVLADRALAARLGSAGRATVIERYSWASLGAAYERTYREVIAARAVVSIDVTAPRNGPPAHPAVAAEGAPNAR